MKINVYIGGFEGITLDSIIELLVSIDADFNAPMIPLFVCETQIGAVVIDIEHLPNWYNPLYFDKVFETTTDHLESLIETKQATKCK